LTLYVSMRAAVRAGGIVDPRLYELSDLPSARLGSIPLETIGSRVAGKNVVFGVHGFNVNQKNGVRALGRLEPLLDLSESDVFFGVLWPGDFWIPVINYPFEGDDARECGKRLATFCRDFMQRAASFSFVSHSLGARLVLEAVRRLHRRTRAVCLTAGAIDRDCLTNEYKDAFDKASLVSVLASHNDLVVRAAFPVGDLLDDILRREQDVRGGLGYDGPPAPVGATVPPWQIPEQPKYGHGDYLPPSDQAISGRDRTNPLWLEPAGFMRRTLRGERQTWPP
jgi:hypothetical protein